MNLEKAALILEGGGMRGVYTAGVLRYFMDRDLYLSYVIGVSMGACNGANYVARQPERNRIVNIHYAHDRRFLSYGRLLFRGELFGMKFIFDTFPHDLVPFDFQTFKQSRQRFTLAAFDCKSGETVYFDKDELDEPGFLTVLQAGSSLPLVQKPVYYQGRVLMDGGIADAVPIQKSVNDGNQRHVLILTQPKGYRKKPSGIAGLVRWRYRQYEGLCRGIATRHIHYNETMELIDRFEERKEIFVIRPAQALIIGRAERDKDRLYAVYDQGYADAQDSYRNLCAYLNDPNPYRV
jgi:predicted patatin/cPLA2 family phospholipase